LAEVQVLSRIELTMIKISSAEELENFVEKMQKDLENANED
jgi:hypothetical protein